MAWNYKKATEIKIPEQKKIVDPRSATSRVVKNYIAKGDENSVPAKQKKPYTVKWFKYGISNFWCVKACFKRWNAHL